MKYVNRRFREKWLTRIKRVDNTRLIKVDTKYRRTFQKIHMKSQ